MLGDDSFSVRPRKGEYMLLDRKSTCVNTVIFQTPSKLAFLEVCATVSFSLVSSQALI